MREVDFLILTNQSLIMNALTTLIEQPLSVVLMEQSQNTVKYMEENINKLDEEKP